MKKIEEIIKGFRKVISGRVFITLSFALIIFLIVVYARSYKKVNDDYSEKQQYKSNTLDNKLRMSGLSIYIGEDEVYRFIRVFGGNLFVGNDSYSKYYSMNSYLLGEIPVTNRLYTYVMQKIDTAYCGNKKNLEYYFSVAANTSYKDWGIFIDKLGEMTGHEFRLPTLDEWEYAARGGRESRGFKYAGSNNIDEVAFYKDNSDTLNGLLICKRKKANELGFYDMSGLVEEITSTKKTETDPFAVIAKDKMNNDSVYYIKRGGSITSTAAACEIVPNIDAFGNSAGARLVLVK